MTLLGYFLGSLFPSIPKRIELVIIVVVFCRFCRLSLLFAHEARQKDAAADGAA